MSVYVDHLIPCIPNERWKWDLSCHMFADTLDELHAMAERLGMRRSWFQNRTDLPHYDLTPGKRAQAVRMGAVEVDRGALVAAMERNRTARSQEAATGSLFGDSPQVERGPQREDECGGSDAGGRAAP